MNGVLEIIIAIIIVSVAVYSTRNDTIEAVMHEAFECDCAV